jgi:hypothetical protein
MKPRWGSEGCEAGEGVDQIEEDVGGAVLEQTLEPVVYSGSPSSWNASSPYFSRT